nr:AAA family ATPase [Polymorphobacter sp.]
MEFQRLRLAGFKSFVEACELRIEPGLTGVVGPNGCGKSNLLEAIRWVMGEGSAKSLRGGGMDDVIFAGTGARPGRDFAEVLLTVEDNGQTHEVVRRIERGLGSAYRLDGRDVRARDVQLLFADAATGAHSPALVSQGRIGAIIAAKPAERRILLEEAAGISGLHVRRREAEIRLKATEANLLRLDDVIAALDAQAAALKRQARTAERYRVLSDRIRAAEGALLFARWSAARTAAASAHAAAAAAEASVVAATRDAARLATAQAEAAVALPELRVAEAGAAAAAQALVQAQRILAAEAEAIARRSRDLAAAAVTLARDRAREDGLARDAAGALERLAGEAAALEALAAKAKAALPEAASAVERAERTAATTESALSTAIEAHARAAASARAAEAALATAEARRAKAAGEADRRDRAREDIDSAGLDARCAAAAGSLDETAARVARAIAAITEADESRRSADAARDAANAEVLTARGDAAGLTAERDALARVLAVGGPSASLLDRIEVAAGDERALAAALGDDLSAGLGEAASGRFWVVAPGDDAPLPVGVEPLRCTAPPELARRLAATGIAAPDDAPGLAAMLLPGQRLVTRDGKMWRWDGFRAFGGQGVATAERLIQRNRLAAVATELIPAEAALADARTALAAAETAARSAGEAERAARVERTAADRAHDAARAALAAATTERDRAVARREASDAAIARLRDDAAGFAREVDAARAAAAEITGLPGLAAAVTEARGSAETARATLARARADHATLARDLDAAVARRAAIAADRAAWTRGAAASAAQIAELDARTAAGDAEAATLAARPAEIAAELAALATRGHAADTARRAAADALATAETGSRSLDTEARAVAETLATAREARARAAADAEHAGTRTREIEAQCGDRFACSPPMLGVDVAGDPAALAHDFETLTAERERIGPVNLRADLELAELAATSEGSAAERAELDTAVARLRGSIGALNREGRVRLVAAFEAVDGHFRTLFGTLFAGGAAHLALIESDDPLEAGLEIMAQPPGKKLQSLTLLSGGEQALTATALIFALFLTTPSPLCVLDEVDAPLDDANVERFCDLLDRMAETTATRFLIVTHNAVTMSRMHRLYGVTMAEPGVSQLVSVDLRAAEHLLAAAE